MELTLNKLKEEQGYIDDTFKAVSPPNDLSSESSISDDF